MYSSIYFIEDYDVDTTVRLSKEPYIHIMDINEESAVEYLVAIEEIDNVEKDENEQLLLEL